MSVGMFGRRKKGRPVRPATREKVELHLPFELLDRAEDMGQQSYLTRTDIFVMAIRAGLPLVAQALGVIEDRAEKVTYRKRGKSA